MTIIECFDFIFEVKKTNVCMVPKTILTACLVVQFHLVLYEMKDLKQYRALKTRRIVLVGAKLIGYAKFEWPSKSAPDIMKMRANISPLYRN